MRPRRQSRRDIAPLTPAQLAIVRLLIEQERGTSTEAGRVVHSHQDPPCESCRLGRCDSSGRDGEKALTDLAARGIVRRIGRCLWAADDRPIRRNQDGGLVRNKDRERLWLESAVVDLGPDSASYVERAICRLDAEQERRGDTLLDPGFEALVTKLEEQAVAVGAWGVLALQAVETDSDVDDVMRDHLWLLVHVAIAMSAYSYQAMMLARDDLEFPGRPHAV